MDELETLIVLSDTHFGRGTFEKPSSRSEDLVKFLKWLDQDRNMQRKDGTRITIDSPQTIVLLGDILELWAPTSEREVFSQAYPFMATLMQFVKKNQEIIYVRGNHDQNMERYKGEFSPNLRVYKQYYTAALKTIESEPKNIVFLHGDEFIWGRTEGISSKIMGYFYRIVTDLFESTRITVLSIFLIAFAWYCVVFYGQATGVPLWSRWVRDIWAGFLGLTSFYAIPSLIRLIGLLVVKKSASRKLKSVSKAYRMVAQQKMERDLLAKARFRFYSMTKKKPTYRKLREIVNGTWETLGWNFQTWWDEYWKEDPWQPDTIVFGHTHVPEGPVRIGDIEGIDEKKISPQLKNKILVNSGCWLKEGKDDQTSFIYINNLLGILLCKFNPVENIGQELGNLEHPSFT